MDQHSIDMSVNYSMGESTCDHEEYLINLEGELEELRETFNSGKTRDASWRRSQLKAILNLLKDNEDDFFRALKQDLGKHRCESYRDEVCMFATPLFGTQPISDRYFGRF